MNPLELITALLAPHLCLICSKESDPLCPDCAKKCFEIPQSRCYHCQKETVNFATCATCRNRSPIMHLWFGSLYAGAAKELIALLKFHRLKAAATVVANCLDSSLPALPESTIIVPVPTANRRVRVRGYDQAELIARKFARRRSLQYHSLLTRLRVTRQVGSSREQRFKQLQGAFTASRCTPLNRPVLLIDDVLTTGATLERAAIVLQGSGCEFINAATFAYQPLQQ